MSEWPRQRSPTRAEPAEDDAASRGRPHGSSFALEKGALRPRSPRPEPPPPGPRLFLRARSEPLRKFRWKRTPRSPPSPGIFPPPARGFSTDRPLQPESWRARPQASPFPLRVNAPPRSLRDHGRRPACRSDAPAPRPPSKEKRSSTIKKLSWKPRHSTMKERDSDDGEPIVRSMIRENSGGPRRAAKAFERRGVHGGLPRGTGFLRQLGKDPPRRRTQGKKRTVSEVNIPRMAGIRTGLFPMGRLPRDVIKTGIALLRKRDELGQGASARIGPLGAGKSLCAESHPEHEKHENGHQSPDPHFPRGCHIRSGPGKPHFHWTKRKASW